jgi:hypothetical protein
MNRRASVNTPRGPMAAHERLNEVVKDVRVPNTAIWFVANRVLVSVTDMTGTRARLAAAGWRLVPGTQEIYECFRTDPGFRHKLQVLVDADGLASCFSVAPEAGER